MKTPKPEYRFGCPRHGKAWKPFRCLLCRTKLVRQLPDPLRAKIKSFKAYRQYIRDVWWVGPGTKPTDNQVIETLLIDAGVADVSEYVSEQKRFEALAKKTAENDLYSLKYEKALVDLNKYENVLMDLAKPTPLADQMAVGFEDEDEDDQNKYETDEDDAPFINYASALTSSGTEWSLPVNAAKVEPGATYLMWFKNLPAPQALESLKQSLSEMNVNVMMAVGPEPPSIFKLEAGIASQVQPVSFELIEAGKRTIRKKA